MTDDMEDVFSLGIKPTTTILKITPMISLNFVSKSERLLGRQRGNRKRALLDIADPSVYKILMSFDGLSLNGWNG